MTDVQRCSANVLGRVAYSGCHRKGIIERDGRWYCKQHDPEARAAFRKARDERWERKWALQRKRDEATDEIHKAEKRLVEFALETYDGYDTSGMIAPTVHKAVASLRKAQAARKSAIEQLTKLREEK